MNDMVAQVCGQDYLSQHRIVHMQDSSEVEGRRRWVVVVFLETITNRICRNNIKTSEDIFAVNIGRHCWRSRD